MLEHTVVIQPDVKQQKIAAVMDSKSANSNVTELVTRSAEGQAEVSQGQADKQQESRATQRKVKATTNDNRVVMLSLDSTVTYASIAQQLHVPISRLKIKYGFPPKLLQAPAAGAEDAALPIKHGDRLSVEVEPSADQGECIAAVFLVRSRWLMSAVRDCSFGHVD